VFAEYIDAAMRHARYEFLADEAVYYGEIAGCQGVHATAPTAEACQSELLNVLEDWVLFRVYMHVDIPQIDAVKLSVKKNMDRERLPTPPVLYKYYAFNEWTRNIFERNEIYFQSPDGFNDPFDSKVSTTYEGTEEQRVSRLMDLWRKGPAKDKKEEDLRPQALDVVKRSQDIPRILRTLERSPERRRKQMGIFCMTSRRDNILMWSHYAAAHTGFCLGFRTANPFFGQALPIEKYSSDRPCLNLIEPPDSDQITKALLTKATDWEYEDEWRIVVHPRSPGVERGPGVQTYPPEALVEVILTCRITPQNRQRIMQWCRTRSPRPAMYWAEEQDAAFGLNIVPIPWES
jgi:hypothetical protein